MKNAINMLKILLVVFSEEDFSLPIYDECKDGYLDNAPQEPAYYNNRLDHQEEEEDPKWDTSLCFLNSEIIVLDSIE